MTCARLPVDERKGTRTVPEGQVAGNLDQAVVVAPLIRNHVISATCTAAPHVTWSGCHSVNPLIAGEIEEIVELPPISAARADIDRVQSCLRPDKVAWIGRRSYPRDAIRAPGGCRHTANEILMPKNRASSEKAYAR